ncbi:MAG TPA: hypothetical protein VKZ53_19195 [Candidatus Angelobacter sp.]|nr:hypothetical protein [Candidatus Angelobacter sp.]
MPVTDKVGKKGRIKTGKYAGFFVRIEDDSENTGGYLILTWQGASSMGYDNWVENLPDLDQFFHDSGWDIEWLE